MAKAIYCSECGMKLTMILKGLPQHGRIISLINPHECLEEPIELDLGPAEPTPTPEGKFVEKLNELPTAAHGAVSTHDLRDRRLPEHIKSSAPTELLKNIKDLSATIPEGPIDSEPEGGK